MMGYGSTKEAIKFVKGLIEHREGPWYLLLLPNNQWAAFWTQGLDIYSELIVDGQYERVCAFVGNKKDTVEYILESLHQDNLHDPLNRNYQIDRIRKSLFRSNSKLNKFVS